jgi:hypothetical protein
MTQDPFGSESVKQLSGTKAKENDLKLTNKMINNDD